MGWSTVVVATHDMVANPCQVFVKLNEDYADLFCELFDGIDAADFRADGESWLAGSEAAGRSGPAVEAAALAGERIAAEAARPSPSCSASTPRSPRPTRSSAGPSPPALSEYALRYAESGRFDSGRRTGRPAPALRTPGRRGQLPDDLADAFGAVVRVRHADWDACDHATAARPTPA